METMIIMIGLEQGWRRSGESTPIRPGFDFPTRAAVIRGSSLGSESFISGCSGFPLSPKTDI